MRKALRAWFIRWMTEIVVTDRRVIRRTLSIADLPRLPIRVGDPAVGASHGEGRVIIPDIHSAYLRASKGSLEKSGL